MSHVLHLRSLVGARPLFSVGAGVLVLDARDRVLLQRRSDNGLWGIPGGGSDLGEALEDTARRELREEAGLTVGPLERLGVYGGPDLHFTYPNGDQIYFAGAVYVARLNAEAPDLKGDDETLELHFFPPDAPPAGISGSLDRAALRDLCRALGRPAPEWPALPLPPAPPAGRGYMTELRAAIGAQPTFGVEAAVLARDERGRVLLRRPASGAWDLPGAPLELGETFEEAARRALMDAAGVRATHLEFLDLLAGPAYVSADPSGGQTHHVSALYSARVPAGAALHTDGAAEVRWFEVTRLPEPLVGPVARTVLAQLTSAP